MRPDWSFCEFNQLNQHDRVEHNRRFGLLAANQINVNRADQQSEPKRSRRYPEKTKVQIQFAEHGGRRVRFSTPTYVTLEQPAESEGKGVRLAWPHRPRNKPVEYLGQRRAHKEMAGMAHVLDDHRDTVDSIESGQQQVIDLPRIFQMAI